jgi:RNA polymerase sigma-70 factor (ECF subfamily)
MSNNENVTFIARLYKRYELNIRKMMMRRTHHAQDIEDIVQNVFLKAHNVADWRNIKNPESYLVAMAKNIYNDHLRKEIKNMSKETEDIFDRDVKDDAPSPEDFLSGKQDMVEFEKVINSLTPRLKQAIIIIKIKKISYAEASEIMNISKRTLENYVTNAMIECRKKIEEQQEYLDLRSYTDKIISLSERKKTEK